MTSGIFNAENRLASYGTLAPGMSNAHQMEGMVGAWRAGSIKGRIEAISHGEHKGLPGLRLEA